MFIRAVIAFLVLPGVVAFLLPMSLVWFIPLALKHSSGFIIVMFGAIALIWCVRDFYVSGKGTLAPWSPPAKLVTIGLYRYSRNPMYVAVTLILFGWGILFQSIALLAYAWAVALAFHLRIIYGEEPWLLRTYGEEWQQYTGSVRRWL